MQENFSQGRGAAEAVRQTLRPCIDMSHHSGWGALEENTVITGKDGLQYRNSWARLLCLLSHHKLLTEGRRIMPEQREVLQQDIFGVLGS